MDFAWTRMPIAMGNPVEQFRKGPETLAAFARTCARLMGFRRGVCANGWARCQSVS
jgi:hypothetical protein